MPVNRLVTRGMGASKGRVGRTGLISQGGGGFLKLVKETAIRVIRVGQSGAKRALRELEEVIVWAKLIRVNDEKPAVQIQGSTKVKVNFTRHIAVMAEGISTRVRKAWEDIKITVKRIR